MAEAHDGVVKEKEIMKAQRVSTCIITDKIDETKLFYTEILNGTVTFDCGWYCSIDLGNGFEVQFMTPQKKSDKLFQNQGVTYNISVENVDAEYDCIKGKDVEIVDEIETHSWGDRSFVICDPNKIRLYIYSDREIGEEYINAVKA